MGSMLNQGRKFLEPTRLADSREKSEKNLKGRGKGPEEELEQGTA